MILKNSQYSFYNIMCVYVYFDILITFWYWFIVPIRQKPCNIYDDCFLNISSLGCADRQVELQEQWYFQCCCPRCSDKSEFGTWTSSITCPNCLTDSSDQSENIYLNPYFLNDSPEIKESSEHVNNLSKNIKELQFTGICGHR